jgi:indole-3-glycerol phosphate synthase
VHLFEDDPLEGRGEASASDWPALVARIDEGDAVALCVTPPADLGAAGAALRASELPALWNEPVLSESQIVEARAAGADAVLLVCALHEPDALAALARAARGYHMAAAFVVHDEEDLARAAAAQAALLVLDARDKATGAADADRIVRLAALSPRRTVLVARGAGDSRALRGKVDSLIVRYT